MSLSTLAKRILSTKYRTMHKAGYISDDLKLTEDGKTRLFGVLLEKFEDDLAAAAQERLDERANKKEEATS